MNRPLLATGPRAEEPRLLAELAARLGLDAFESGRDPHGRPTLRSGRQTLAFSRSRAGGLCALALAPRGRVGVDLVDPSGWDLADLEPHFSPMERTWLGGLEPPARRAAAARAWAGREALLKALGLGLAGAGTLDLRFDPEGIPRLSRIAGGLSAGWHLEFSRAEGLALALAWAD